MKIGICTDVHANLPAMAKALEFFRREQCQQIYHVGDLIGIGPYPRECMELAFSTPGFVPIMGNHDYWYGHAIPYQDDELMEAFDTREVPARDFIRSNFITRNV